MAHNYACVHCGSQEHFDLILRDGTVGYCKLCSRATSTVDYTVSVVNTVLAGVVQSENFERAALQVVRVAISVFSAMLMFQHTDSAMYLEFAYEVVLQNFVDKDDWPTFEEEVE